jgi:hypothetical protein
MTPFPTTIDSSMIAAFRSCPRKCQLDFFDHWKPKTPSVHLHAGGAYARGMEVARLAYFADGASEIEAIARGGKALVEFYGSFECPPDSAKSLERTLGAFEFYFSQYPLADDRAKPITLPSGRLGVEFNFVEPLDFLHPVTGDPLLYCGRFDMLCDYNGAIFGEDDKTTSQLGASWPKQWDLRSQFTAYCWGAKRASIPIAGFIVRGVSILKTKYDTQQAITYRPQWMIDEWYEQLVLRDLPAMVRMWETGEWGASLDHACNDYGGCGFRQVCLAAPESRVSWLETSFERRRWDPVERVETRLG